MKLRITQVVLTVAAMMVFGMMAPSVFARHNQKEKDKDKASEEMKDSGRETGRAGERLGHNVKHGRIIHGGKRFGQHIGRAGKHFGRSTRKAVHTAVKP